VEEQLHVFGPWRFASNRQLHRFVDQRRLHPDFRRLFVLPIEALGEIRRCDAVLREQFDCRNRQRRQGRNNDRRCKKVAFHVR